MLCASPAHCTCVPSPPLLLQNLARDSGELRKAIDEALTRAMVSDLRAVAAEDPSLHLRESRGEAGRERKGGGRCSLPASSPEGRHGRHHHPSSPTPFLPRSAWP